MASLVVAVIAMIAGIWAVGPFHGRHDHDGRVRLPERAKPRKLQSR